MSPQIEMKNVTVKIGDEVVGTTGKVSIVNVGRQAEDRVHRPAITPLAIHIIGCNFELIAALQLSEAEILDTSNLKRKKLAMLYGKITETERKWWEPWVGRRVRKPRKPFKSGRRANTVKAVIKHPITGQLAFTFEEDNSYVECRCCELEAS